MPFLTWEARTHSEDWSYRWAHGELRNDQRVIGLVGFSRAGRRMAERFDPVAKSVQVARTCTPSVDLEEFHTRSDAVSLQAPAVVEGRQLRGS